MRTRRIFQFFAFLAILITGPVFSDYYGTAGCWEPVCNTFTLDIDFLYFKPSFDDLDYAATLTFGDEENLFQPGGSKYKVNSICPDWEPGIRISMARSCSCDTIGVRASYMFIEGSKSSSTLEQGGVRPVISHPRIIQTLFDKGKGSWSMRHHEADLLLTDYLVSTYCHQFQPFFGIAGLYLEQNFTARSGFITSEEVSTPEEIGKWDMGYWGLGFRLGSEYRYKVSQCLSFYACGHFSVLAGNANSKISTAGILGDKIAFKDGKCVRITNGSSFGSGFILSSCYCGYDIEMKIGYEIKQWNNLPRHRIFESEFGGSSVDFPVEDALSSTGTKNYGFHGLVAGLRISF